MSGIQLKAPVASNLYVVIETKLVPATAATATTGGACFCPFPGDPAMLEEPGIIQMNIDRYRALLQGPLASEQRTSIQRLLAEALHHLPRAVDPDQQHPAAGLAVS
jgi:hypothetical protein